MKTNYPAKLLLALTLLALFASNAAAQINVTTNHQSSKNSPIKLAASIPGESTSDEGETF